MHSGICLPAIYLQVIAKQIDHTTSANMSQICPFSLEELNNFYHGQRVLWLRRSSFVSGKAEKLQS